MTLDLGDLFSIPVDSGEHPEEIDLDLEFDRMLERNQLIAKLENGMRKGTLSKGDFEQFEDMLAEHNINPNSYGLELDAAFYFALDHNLLSFE